MSGGPYLLDTPVLIWALADDPRLPATHRGIFLRDEEVVVSAASILEIAVLQADGKIGIDGDIVRVLRQHRIPVLPVTERHAARVAALPLHHRDPFDRLLIATAQLENLTLVSADPRFARYEVALA